MASKELHVEPRIGGRWAVKKSGFERATIVTFTLKEALSAARKLAKAGKLQIVVYDENGRIAKPPTEKTKSKAKTPRRQKS